MQSYQNNPLAMTLMYYSRIIGKNNIDSVSDQEWTLLQNLIEDVRLSKQKSSEIHHTKRVPMMSQTQADRSNISVHRLQQDIRQLNTIVEKHDVPIENHGNSTRQFRSDKILHNPYSYGSEKNMLDPLVHVSYQGGYYNNPEVIRDMGLTQVYSPNGIRNTDIESSLIQSESTHTPGQNALTQIEFNRFPFDFNPQNPDGYTWRDNMPKTGYSTRINSNNQYML